MSTESPIAGVRLPGRSALLFCRADDLRPAVGEWVAVATGWGLEAGCVAVQPEQVALAPSPAGWPVIARRLTPEEIERVIGLAERARSIMGEMLAGVESSDVTSDLVGLRFTLDGSGVIAMLVVDDEPDVERVRADLAGRSGVSVEIETTPRGGNLFGGLGRLRPRYDSLDQILRERFDLPGGEHVPAPEGFPRLGDRVRTSSGSGRLVAVSLRRQEATVERDDAAEINVPLDDLTPAGE